MTMIIVTDTCCDKVFTFPLTIATKRKKIQKRKNGIIFIYCNNYYYYKDNE